MSKRTRPVKPQAPKLPKGEAEQVRIRREIGHDFALRDDAFGRKRLAAGTLEAARVYEVSNDGYAATGGIVRVRAIDALVGITSLSRQQREAGLRYREDFRCSQQADVKPMRWTERVDGGRDGGGIADSVLDAGRAYAAATRALGHWEVAAVVRQVCCADGSLKRLSEQTGEGRNVVTKLLKVGLDLLAVHYGMMMRR
ncbi:hypothetical protein EOD10_19780 [Mesorhizobium sp. M7A.T.Ca.TU.009.01.3.2]|jgi:hypothetical protein|uniref:DUF6456 domain-containing protein n=1 Tax=unclassified Mesorhizobium TaxID=325217 RepID=UPI000FCA7B02|nr:MULTISPECIES: DUF6456 domain-containing protein [unclassified Mesorhizobium]RUU10932.1 hypothetical protein EOD10_19780 [Mesorhizobium sp. M7A.T.Ca.TU.009.01.3.2]RUU54661.1 hypothetical protein EOC99_29135 [Mesorhizobium sp. M7A.T.Ca.TU.009.01.1.1]RUU74729.1 hypothetical protein EOD03_26125 [Mesorhizobium sp. M7A.T.Ca.TU.009.01.1.2]RUU95321.1 hypothetical protein EOD00_26310 [Mesorhizobium sp. M7A.T.Ca.TU.009.01.3.1]RUV51525.1 hypothetical protein EOB77_10575 [Mesorhizobium sp. M7A.F.Ca.MR.